MDANHDIPNGQDSAYAIKIVGATRDIPGHFVERADGLVLPERAARTQPRMSIVGEVNDDMLFQVASNLQKITDRDSVTTMLHIDISSPGGEVSAGLGIYGLLSSFCREHHTCLIMTGYGRIDSMSSLVIQAAHRRRLEHNTRMLLHPISSEPGTIMAGDQSRHMADETNRLRDTCARIVSARVCQAIAQKHDKGYYAPTRTALPEGVIELMEANMGAGTVITAQTALELGLIDEIV